MNQKVNFSNKIIYSFEPILEVLEKQKKFFNYNLSN